MRFNWRWLPAGAFLIFLATVAYWADTNTMPAIVSAMFQFPNGDRVGHVVLYGMATALLDWVIGERRPWTGSVIMAIGAAAEEASQLFIATRTADWVDLGCGLAGIATAHLVFVFWRAKTAR